MASVLLVTMNNYGTFADGGGVILSSLSVCFVFLLQGCMLLNGTGVGVGGMGGMGGDGWVRVWVIE